MRPTPLALALFAVASAFVPAARAGDPEKVTEARVRAALAEARAALEKECGAKLDAGLALRFATAAEIGQRIAEENMAFVRLRQPDEEKARAEAQSLGDTLGAITFAKYSWNPRELLVVPRSLEAQARQQDLPELCSDTTLRALMVHELVHAWDDSLHGIPALFARADSLDAAGACNALLEGHAQHVARRVCKARGWSAGFETYTGVIGRVPDSSKELGEATLLMLRVQGAAIGFSYRDGERFVAALESAGGAEAVARAFREPPRDGESILHPEWYLDPKKRPAVLYEPEPALDLFVARFPGSVWSAQRLSIQSSQMEAGLALLPKEEAHALAASVRSARYVMLYPTANPNEKIVSTAVVEFGSETEALAYLAASDRLSKLKDEKMKTGLVRITGSSTSAIRAEGRTGWLQTKQMKNGALAFEVQAIDLLRGKVVVETLFSGEAIAVEEHIQLATELLAAVKLRQAK
jgi:hypothetical protein